MKTTLHVNNTTHELSADPRLTLLDALRDVPGMTGSAMAAAIANAVYHATGARIRSLPISIEKVLGVATHQAV